MGQPLDMQSATITTTTTSNSSNSQAEDSQQQAEDMGQQSAAQRAAHRGFIELSPSDHDSTVPNFAGAPHPHLAVR
jgi:hypothetical protein